ncbi:MAG: rod shape-determining protein RodA [Cyclobacteriaceae bacterium]
MRGERLTRQIDWLTIFIYLTLVVLGWFNIYAADYDPELNQSMFSLSQSSGKQLLWIGTAMVLIIIVLALDYRFYEQFSFIVYGVAIFLLVFVLFFGKEVAGSRSWFEIGSFRLQPSEFAKIAAALGLAKFFGTANRKVSNNRDLILSSLFFLTPLGLIVLQGDAGTAMVYLAFFIVLFREGMSPMLLMSGLGIIALFLLTLVLNKIILIIGIVVITLVVAGIMARSLKRAVVIGIAAILSIGIVVSVEFVLNDVLKSHQRKRVNLLINPNADPLGVGWNTTQSKIAIGSGGWTGKGYLDGTQTKFDFVPAQTTDFIFCTVGEEHGWIGSTAVLIIFAGLLFRLSFLAERQKSLFTRVYGYSVIAVIFFHFVINISMTIGLFPVIGIPLPFFSYGGSSLWSFTILLFIFLKLDAHRMQVLQRSS